MHVAKSKEKLEENITLVRDLLNKQKLIETMVHLHDSRKHELVESLVHRQHLAELDAKLKRVHSADLAHVLDVLPVDDRLRVWQRIAEQRGGEVLMEVADSVRQNLIDNMSEDELRRVLRQLDGDDLAYITDDIPETLLQDRLQSLSEEDQHWLRSAMQYDEDSVGYLMSNEMVVVRDSDTLAAAAKHLRGLHELPIHNDKLLVVDRRGILKGVLTLQNILLNEPDRCVTDVMATDIVTFSPDDDASEASKAFERYDLVSAPVVNQRGKLLGRLTVDVVMDYIRDESTEDVLVMAGISAEEDLFSSVWTSTRNRSLWLVINLFTAFVASRVIGLFEATIAQLVALAALMPIVASIGGNSSNQTTALIIRAMSLGQITPQNTRYLIRKEIGVSAINGVTLGLAVGLFAFLLYQNLSLAVVIAASMLFTLIVAAILGFSIPLILERNGHDPALGSSVITTAMTDSVGFFIFLGLASIFLI